MMGKAFLVVLGILLIGLAVTWFATPLGNTVTNEVRVLTGQVPDEQPESLTGPRTRSLRPAPRSGMDILKMALDFANVAVGLIGIFLTWRSMRAGAATARPRE